MRSTYNNKELHCIREELLLLRSELLKLAISWTHDTDLSEDLVQVALMKALKQVHTIRNRAVLKVWIVRILRNSWWDYLRRKKTRDTLRVIMFEEADVQLNSFHQQDIVRTVRRVVSGLPDKQREVLTLADFSGFSYAEIATIVSVPIGTVMSRLFAARKHVREQIYRSEKGNEKLSHIRCVK